MCGIVGARHDWLRANGREPAAAMHAAVAALAWRGPDGEGVERAGPWWLGCARLAIGPARSRQPVVRRGGRFVGVLNGAISNARSLWAQQLPGVERRATLPNDAWLPLLAVAADDDTTLAQLRGHHAYAVVDAHTGTLWFGQDRFGEKPLWCLVDRLAGRPQLVAFASTLGALHELGMPTSTSPRRLAELFRFGWAPLRSERFTARRRCEPVPRRGEPLRTTAAGPCWWQAARGPVARSPASPAQDSSPPPSPGPAPRSLRTELLASVARSVDTGVPVGLSLSGGLDSSCLALALHELGRSVPAYQLRAAGTSPAERTAATAVALRAGLPLRPVDVDMRLADELPLLTAYAGQPLGDPSVLALFAVARAAAADGVRVLLGGEGADESLLGYRRYRALSRLPRLPWLRRIAPRWSMRYPARWLRAAAADDPVTALLAVTPPAFAELVLAPGLARRGCWFDRRLHDEPPPPRGPALALDARRFDVAHYLRADLLPKADIACMAAGVEGRSPFLDGDLAPFGATLQALGKAPLRAAFAAELPPEVLALPKRGFALPLDRWFRGELPWLDLLAEPRTRQRPHLCRDGIARAVALHRRGRADLGHGLYLLVAVELFLRSQEPRIHQLVRTSSTSPA